MLVPWKSLAGLWLFGLLVFVLLEIVDNLVCAPPLPLDLDLDDRVLGTPLETPILVALAACWRF